MPDMQKNLPTFFTLGVLAGPSPYSLEMAWDSLVLE